MSLDKFYGGGGSCPRITCPLGGGVVQGGRYTVTADKATVDASVVVLNTRSARMSIYLCAYWYYNIAFSMWNS